MFSAQEGRGSRRRGRTAIPAAAVAAGVASLFLAVPAQAGTPQPPVLHPAGHTSAPSQAELRARVAGAVAADSGPSRTTLSADPKASGSTHTVDPKIIGGTTTTISSAPWMAQLWYDDGEGNSFFCGGTVVSPSKILTAAHCVAGYDWATNGVIVTGTDQLPTANTDGSANLHGGTVTGLWRQWSNPQYDHPAFDNDVALLTLDVPVTAKPLPITTASDSASYVTGTNGTVYGWGRTSSGSQDISQTLRKATLPVAANTACSAPLIYGSTFVAGHMVCAGTPASGTDAGTTATCNGDSGGPLVVAGKIVGVVSWGVEDCVDKGTYSVFSRVSAYVGAINPRIDDANLNLDDKADLLAVTSAGSAYEYDSTGSGFASKAGLGDFSGLNLFRQSDLNRDDFQDLVVRTTDGHLYSLDGMGNDLLIGPGWNVMKSIITPGDITGDGLPDVVATDSSGNSWTYPGNGKGGLGSRTKIGAGWNIFNGQIYGKGDLTGDGRPDIIARDSSGALWLYKGTGSASGPWAARTKVGTGWTAYNAFDAVGDITGDGKADLVARDSSGTLWLYKGTGSASGPYSAKVKIGTGWNAYRYFG